MYDDDDDDDVDEEDHHNNNGAGGAGAGDEVMEPEKKKDKPPKRGSRLSDQVDMDDEPELVGYERCVTCVAECVALRCCMCTVYSYCLTFVASLQHVALHDSSIYYIPYVFVGGTMINSTTHHQQEFRAARRGETIQRVRNAQWLECNM